jgi:hypothetical protein
MLTLGVSHAECAEWVNHPLHRGAADRADIHPFGQPAGRPDQTRPGASAAVVGMRDQEHSPAAGFELDTGSRVANICNCLQR